MNIKLVISDILICLLRGSWKSFTRWSWSLKKKSLRRNGCRGCDSSSDILAAGSAVTLLSHTPSFSALCPKTPRSLVGLVVYWGDLYTNDALFCHPENSADFYDTMILCDIMEKTAK